MPNITLCPAFPSNRDFTSWLCDSRTECSSFAFFPMVRWAELLDRTKVASYHLHLFPAVLSSASTSRFQVISGVQGQRTLLRACAFMHLVEVVVSNWDLGHLPVAKGSCLWNANFCRKSLALLLSRLHSSELSIMVRFLSKEQILINTMAPTNWVLLSEGQSNLSNESLLKVLLFGDGRLSTYSNSKNY